MNAVEVEVHVSVESARNDLKISPTMWRFYARDLRQILSNDEFDYFPHDRAISPKSLKAIKRLKELTNQLGYRLAKQLIQEQGV